MDWSPIPPRGRQSRAVFLGAALVWLSLAACDTLESANDTFRSEVVVESYQIAGEPLQRILLSRTVPIDETYEFDRKAVSGAQVVVHLLDQSGGVAQSFGFAESSSERGVYEATDDHRVRPLHSYRLEVSLPEGGTPITATTVVPDTFRVVAANRDTVVYQSAQQLEVSVSLSSYPGRQNVYIIVSKALEPKAENLTPLASAILGDDYTQEDLEDAATGSSPTVNEGNYDLNPDGTLSIKFPWIGVVFFGKNELIINAIDDNVLDFVRSQSVQQGGSTFSPGEIPNVLEHIEGGQGVFGSYASVRASTVVLRSN